MHANHIFTYVQNYPQFNVARLVESSVGNSSTSLRDKVQNSVHLAVQCIQHAGALHWGGFGLPPFPVPSNDVWFWSNGSGQFQRQQGEWWGLDQNLNPNCV
jgi:hypothetical protein